MPPEPSSMLIDPGPAVLLQQVLHLPGGYDALPWEPFREGIRVHWLYRHDDGGSAALLRYEPGAALPRHRHVAREHILILEGSQSDDNGEHLPGTLVVHTPGTSHTVHSPRGCVVLALWERPVVFEPAR